MNNCKGLVLALCLLSTMAHSQYYDISGKSKIESFRYCLKIMDSLVAAKPNDSLFTCHNCIGFIEKETKIYSAGKTTYFGKYEFSKGDLKKWHQWFFKNEPLITKEK